jgi:hypothetical protein
MRAGIHTYSIRVSSDFIRRLVVSGYLTLPRAHPVRH